MVCFKTKKPGDDKTPGDTTIYHNTFLIYFYLDYERI